MRYFVKLVSVLIVLAVLPVGVPSRAEQVISRSAFIGRYFLVVWDYQSPDDDVVQSHTFASFYRGDEIANGIIKPATISWLPATGVVQPFGSENGHNFTLSQTLKMACRLGRTVKSWGPYEIEPALYRRALKRVRLLNLGRIQYSMLETTAGSMNCIDAAGNITPAPLDSGLAWGFLASEAIVQHLSPYFIPDKMTEQALKRTLTRNACSR